MESGKYKPHLMRHMPITNALVTLLWYGSKHSDYVLITDVSYKPIGGALKKIFDEVRKVHPKRDSVRKISFSDNWYVNTVYPVDFLKSKMNFLFWSSAFGSYKDIFWLMEYFTRSRENIQGEKLFLFSPKNSLGETKNPSARIANNMAIHHQYHAANPYNHGSPFWSMDAPVNSSINIRFDQPCLIGRILIETGLNVFLQDSFHGAVLEASYVDNSQNEQENENGCGKFYYVSDFSALYVDVRDCPALQRPVVCLRVRITEKPDSWIAIRKFIVEPKVKLKSK